MRSRSAPLVLFVAVAVGTACRRAEPEPDVDAGAPVRVATARAEATVVPATLASTGTLVGARQADLSPLVSGRIVRLHVEIGDRVAEGDPILELRKDDFRSQAAAAQAALEQARARAGDRPEKLPDVEAARLAARMARRDLERDERLAARGVISEAALEQSRTRAKTTAAQYDAALDAAKGAVSAVEGAEAQAEQARRALADATLRAPFAGEIADRGVAVGEYVTPQSKAVRLVEVDRLRVRLAVPQEQVPLVHVGQPVSVRVDARPDRTFPGAVRYVSAAVDPESRVLEIEAEVPNPEGLLRPGYFVRAEIALDAQRRVVTVPASAIVDRGDNHSVFVVVDDEIEERVVEIASREDGVARIEAGVREGEWVVVDDPGRLRDGMRVER